MGGSIGVITFDLSDLEMIYGKSIGVITFDLSDLERSISRSLRFRNLISSKGAELGPVRVTIKH